jgi:hypothetical protein
VEYNVLIQMTEEELQGAEERLTLARAHAVRQGDFESDDPPEIATMLRVRGSQHGQAVSVRLEVLLNEAHVDQVRMNGGPPYLLRIRGDATARDDQPLRLHDSRDDPTDSD